MQRRRFPRCSFSLKAELGLLGLVGGISLAVTLPCFFIIYYPFYNIHWEPAQCTVEAYAEYTLQRSCMQRPESMWIGDVMVRLPDNTTVLKHGCSSMHADLETIVRLYRGCGGDARPAYYHRDSVPGQWLCQKCFTPAGCASLMAKRVGNTVPCWHGKGSTYVMFHGDTVLFPKAGWALLWMLGFGIPALCLVVTLWRLALWWYAWENPSLPHPAKQMMWGVQPNDVAAVNVNDRPMGTGGFFRMLALALRDASAHAVTACAVGVLLTNYVLLGFAAVAWGGVVYAAVLTAYRIKVLGPCSRAARMTGDPVTWATVPVVSLLLPFFDALPPERAAIIEQSTLSSKRLCVAVVMMAAGLCHPLLASPGGPWQEAFAVAAGAYVVSFAAVVVCTPQLCARRRRCCGAREPPAEAQPLLVDAA